jgi:hypothetical protein
MIRKCLFLSLFGVLSLSACDASSPTATQEVETEAALEELAVEALDAAEEEGYPLPSLQRLLRETYQTIRNDREAHSEGLTLLRRARSQAMKAQEAREGPGSGGPGGGQGPRRPERSPHPGSHHRGPGG